MSGLQRITTQYHEAEDRIRLSGEIAADQKLVLWLTQRLLTRLLPLLFKWLEDQAKVVRGDVLQGFAQQAAVAALEPQQPVQIHPQSESWLVQVVDVTTGTEVLTLTFKDGGTPGQSTSISLPARPLRQWLNILYQQYRRADWPSQVWPQWMIEAQVDAAAGKNTMMH